MQNYRPGTFDSRVIEYEKVHQITNEQVTALLKALDLQKGQKVLDGCCGYGSVTKWLLSDINKDIVSTCNFFLFDDSAVQIERAKDNLKEHTGLTYDVGDIKSLPYEDMFFDIVVIKMGLHENPKDVQAEIAREAFRVLKPGGKFVVWELYLNNLTQPIFQSFIHKKDELAGFDTLAQKRYFPRGDEIMSSVINAGFENFIEHYVFNPILETKVRLGELVSRELKESGLSEPDTALEEIATQRLNALNDFFRNELNDEQKKIINFKDEGDNIIIYNIDKAIVSATKPL
jgi:ubiquinone/menaquinone biosynthesis C-methylase UbiE